MYVILDEFLRRVDKDGKVIPPNAPLRVGQLKLGLVEIFIKKHVAIYETFIRFKLGNNLDNIIKKYSLNEKIKEKAKEPTRPS